MVKEIKPEFTVKLNMDTTISSFHVNMGWHRMVSITPGWPYCVSVFAFRVETMREAASMASLLRNMAKRLDAEAQSFKLAGKI
jgi:hypothetical protein